MKRWIKAIAKKLWGATGPVRRPVARRIDARLQHHLTLALRATLAESLGGVRHELAGARQELNVVQHRVDLLHQEMDLLLDSNIRELTRLQLQVETLRQAIDDALAGPAGLALVAPGDDAHESRPATMRAG